jgi:hypothetical protein
MFRTSKYFVEKKLPWIMGSTQNQFLSFQSPIKFFGKDTEIVQEYSSYSVSYNFLNGPAFRKKI